MSNRKAKKMLFPNTCGGCAGHYESRNGSTNTGFLCVNCSPKGGQVNYMDTVCEKCPFLIDCTARVGVGAWVRCESPDRSDAERLLGRYRRYYDEATRSALENALAGRGDRKILEEAVSQSSQTLYQSIIEGLATPQHGTI